MRNIKFCFNRAISLTKNKIQNFEETVAVLAGFPDLKELDLDRNPVVFCLSTPSQYELVY